MAGCKTHEGMRNEEYFFERRNDEWQVQRSRTDVFQLPANAF